MLEDDFCIKLLPTLLEVLELFYFAEHFLTAKVSRAKRYLANVCFYLLDCGATALRKNLQMINANIDSWKEAYMEQRRYTHDFQNKLLVLRGLAGKEGTPAELQAYLNELLHDTRPCAYCLDTHRPIADALLSQKQALAKSNSVLHGFGLRNVLYVLDKNQAVYQISYSEETHSFQFVAQITSAQ